MSRKDGELGQTHRRHALECENDESVYERLCVLGVVDLMEEEEKHWGERNESQRTRDDKTRERKRKSHG